ncbi:proline-specific peptidase [Legionella massiliensis]|uniref:Proline-specific peptidase n=1 Tax=Legionella massiliensis TaxID=1034943 RepID=A0A078L3F7_9GAMM|nr:alpha/beta hydrolase [Legionella massiliensis]CDZ78473.1 proline-specific peptidase [Legionella massiliensis]CEE14211.1 Alpha/beta hydrolase family protein [Legionella massiliensis]
MKKLILISLLITLSAAAFSKGTLVTINNERKLFLNCQGQGSPTVLLISGYLDRGDASWETPLSGSLFSKVSQFTKVCDFDRPGTIKVRDNHFLKSRSDPVQQPVTAEDQVKDLQALVKAAKIKKPFIIVAHSAGGLSARLYAYKYPSEVSGLILIDVTNEKLLDTWTDKEIEIFNFSTEKGSKEIRSLYKNVERINFIESFKQLQQYKDQKLNLPAILLTAGKTPDANQLIKDGLWPNFATQDLAKSIMSGIYQANELVAESFVPRAKLLNVKNSGHYIQKEQPELILELIHTMVEQQRS